MSLLIVVPEQAPSYAKFFEGVVKTFSEKRGVIAYIATPDNAVSTACVTFPEACIVVDDNRTKKITEVLCATGGYPIMAVGKPESMIEALATGANFFLPTPFWHDHSVLYACYKAMLPLNMPRELDFKTRTERLIYVHRIKLDREQRRVCFGEKKQILPAKLFAIFELLLKSPDRVVSTPFIIEQVWPDCGTETRKKSLSQDIYKLKIILGFLTESITITSGIGWYMLSSKN